MIQTKILQRNEVKTYNIVKAYNVNKYTYIIGDIHHRTQVTINTQTHSWKQFYDIKQHNGTHKYMHATW